MRFDELGAVCGLTLRPGGLTLTREALALGRFDPGDRLLDLGCGLGGTLKFLREAGFEALGLDSSPTMLASARQYGPALEADFHDLPFADESFEGIFCECVLSLTPTPGEVLSECFRVLKTDGRLLVSDLSASSTFWDFGLIRSLSSAGFSLRVCLDRSRYLKELAAQLLWHFDSAGILEMLRISGGARCPEKASSYYLLLAEK